MKKILGLIVLLAAIWAVPAARSKAISFMQPAVDKMGPFGAKLSTPMRRYSARTQIASILRGVNVAREAGKEVPVARTFVSWLRAHPPSDKKENDPWGNPYTLQHENSTYTVTSAGPDGVLGNADDISKTTTL
ncbi:MAG: type II secretion system protein GspG [Longimicrobiales bacterium]